MDWQEVVEASEYVAALIRAFLHKFALFVRFETREEKEVPRCYLDDFDNFSSEESSLPIWEDAIINSYSVKEI